MVVALVPVALTKVRFVRFKVSEKRSVKVPLVEKKSVVVALVVVEFTAVKFWRVVEPVVRRFERVVRPPVAVRVVPIPTDPVKFAALEMVWPLIRPEVMVLEPISIAPKPEVMEPELRAPTVVMVFCPMYVEAISTVGLPETPVPLVIETLSVVPVRTLEIKESAPFPTSNPAVKVLAPVPPYATEIVEEADTVPFTA